MGLKKFVAILTVSAFLVGCGGESRKPAEPEKAPVKKNPTEMKSNVPPAPEPA
ncbi:MAG: hypothetical protein U0905_03050 [Pirellulales bacterium]